MVEYMVLNDLQEETTVYIYVHIYIYVNQPKR